MQKNGSVSARLMRRILSGGQARPTRRQRQGTRHRPAANQGVAGERQEEQSRRCKPYQPAEIIEADIFKLDLKEAEVVTLYLLPALNVKLIPQLEKLTPGTRIVSHDFDMQGVTPDQEVKVEAHDREHTVYVWTTPLKKEKETKESE
jgi:hypothetical protein